MRVRGRLLSALAYALTFLVLASVLPQRLGFPLDDSWIHQVIARNFAQYHRLGFIPGQLTTGSTSPLWSCVLALCWVLFPRVSPVVTSAGVSLILLVCIGYVLKAITEEDALPAPVGWCLALGPLASGNFVWLGMIGMEHLLFILLSLCLIRQWLLLPELRSRADLLLLAGLSVLLTLARPEGMFLSILLLLTVRVARRTLSALLSVIAGNFVGGILLMTENWIVGHHLAPQTMQGRQFLYSSARLSWLRLRSEFLGHVIAQCMKVWSLAFPRDFLHGRGLLVGAPVLSCIALFLWVAGTYLYQSGAVRVLLLAAWALLTLLLYGIVLPAPGHGGRYVSLVLMLFMPLVILGLYRCLLGLRLPSGRASVLVGLLAFASAAWSLHLWRFATKVQIFQIESEHGAMAEWLQKNLPPDVIAQRGFAVFDIGRVGYSFHGNVVDLGGLMDPSFLSYVRQKRTGTYLAEHHIQYIVLPSEMGDESANWRGILSLEDSRELRLIPLHTICVDQYTDWVAENSASTAYACQRAYKLVYEDKHQL